MNFYKHHLGDYDGATSHLSWDEDMAYSRLMRVYYRREKPIAHPERYRLVRAVSKLQRAAVDRVLAEFFTRTKGLWRNKRCEEELAAYHEQVVINRRIARERTVHEPSTNRARSVDEASTVRSRTVDLTTNQIPDTKNQIFKPDLDLTYSPTRVQAQVKSVLKKMPKGQDPRQEQLRRGIAQAFRDGAVIVEHGRDCTCELCWPKRMARTK